MTAQLKKDGYLINHKRVERLMRLLGIEAIYPKPSLSGPHPDHRRFPYLLRGIKAQYPNHIWGTDITYVRALGIWFYLVAILDWFSRYVVAWTLSPTLEAAFCVENLTKALAVATPEIHNSDQGTQFTSEEYLQTLEAHADIRISMDGRGHFWDNIMTERLWRTVKYEDVYLKEYASGAETKAGLTAYFRQYNERRLHASLGYRTPAEVYFGS